MLHLLIDGCDKNKYNKVNYLHVTALILAQILALILELIHILIFVLILSLLIAFSCRKDYDISNLNLVWGK